MSCVQQYSKICISISNINLVPFQIDIHRGISPLDITDICKSNQSLSDCTHQSSRYIIDEEDIKQSNKSAFNFISDYQFKFLGMNETDQCLNNVDL